jgi:phage gp36-like protein
MTYYATKQDLIDRFGADELIQLTDRTNAGVIDDAVLDRALDDADREINAHVAARYVLPFASPPPILTRLAADIARYFLYEDRATDQVKDRYNAAVRLLRSVSTGAATLGPDAGHQAPAAAGGPEVAAPERVFSRDTLVDY